MLWRDRTRKFDGVTHVVVQTRLTRTHRRLLNRHRAVQKDISALAKFTNLEQLTLFTGKPPRTPAR